MIENFAFLKAIYLPTKNFVKKRFEIFFRQKELVAEHDRIVFKKLSKIVNEGSINDLVDSLITRRGFDRGDLKPLDEVLEFSEYVENEFLNQSIKRSFDDFVDKISGFRSHVSQVFFRVEEGSNHYILYPELKDDKPDVYYRAVRDMERLGLLVKSSFKNFRKEVKIHLVL